MLFYAKCPKKEIDAVLEYVNGKFILKKGSKVSKGISTSFVAAKKVKQRREEKGILKDNVLLCDYIFTSPTLAGEFVYGTTFNGRLRWKNKDKKSIGEFIKE